jgi:hypothetical protein
LAASKTKWIKIVSEIVRRRLDPAVLRWVWLVLIALAEVTWLSIRIEAPPAGLLSYTKGFPSIFVTSLAVATVLGWARYRGRLLELPIFQDFSHNPWGMVLAHLGAFAAFFYLQFS